MLAAITALPGISGLDRLSYGGELQADAESPLAADEIREHIGRGGTDLLIVYRSPALRTDEPAFRAAVENSLGSAPVGLLTHTATQWNSGLPVLRSRDGHATIVVAMLAGADDTVRTKNYRLVRTALLGGESGFDIAFTGPISLREAVITKAQDDLHRTELLAFPVVFLLLLLVFRSVVAALLPLLVGGIAISVTFGLMRVLTEFTTVSALAMNAVTLLCLAFAVDAGLFVVGRFREELARGSTVEDAVVVTVATAGRTCFFSCTTIGVITLGMLFFPTGLTYSVGLCTALAMAMATWISVTLLPATLALLGHRLNTLPVRLPTRPGGSDRFWGAIGRAVVAEPVGYLVASLTVLAVLTMPFFHVTLGFPDQRALPVGDSSRVATEKLREDFAIPSLDLIQVVVRTADPGDTAATRTWTRRLSGVPGVQAAVIVAGAGRHTAIYVYAGESEAESVLGVVREIRALASPTGGAVLAGGAAAMAVDLYDLLVDRLPWVLLFIAVTALVMLGVLLRSIVLPLKALVVNALSIGAAFGVLTWIFQDGHLTWLVGATPTGYLDVVLPLMLLVILVGLAMDYEFFLLSRIREHYERTGENSESTVVGLQRSAPVFTGAALVVLVIAAVFASSEVVFVKQLCVGIFVAVIVDATLVRAVLVPASMRLLGRANWWLPRPKSRHSRAYGRLRRVG